MIDALIQSLKQQLQQLKSIIELQKHNYRYTSLQISLNKPISLSAVTFCDSFFLSQPDSGCTLLGLDPLLTFSASGEQRFNSIKNDYSCILKQWYRAEDDITYSPIAFLAFAFDETDQMDDQWQSLANTLLTIPRVLIKETDSSQTLIINIELDKTCHHSAFTKISALLHQLITTEPPETEKTIQTSAASLISNDKHASSAYRNWQSLTENAIKQIRTGQFDKLVTSRQSTLQTATKISIPELIQKLVKYYPACSILSYHTQDKTMVAASPERLLSLQHPDIQSKAIGGTISRNKQLKNKPAPLPFFLKQAIEQTGDELAESSKLLKEHQFISQSIYQNLDPLCHTLKMPIAPFLMKLHNLYHLETPIQGKLMDKYDLFDCINALHPTPAVAGIPTQQAKQWLLDNENYHRGWYTGAFGWIDANMNGDLFVMLRCALLQKQKNAAQVINLFSGAGLVAESDPDAEWQETELKMQTIIEML